MEKENINNSSISFNKSKGILMSCPTLKELPPPPKGKTGWPWIVESPTFSKFKPDGKPWPKISIVTPSYNQGQFLEETIRSVLLQGYPDIEYFIIDGGSSDNSVEIIYKYRQWLSGWVSEKDQGQSDAINKGLINCSGTLLAWLNSDDRYLPNCFSTIVMAFENNPQAGMIYGNIRNINDHGLLLTIPKWKPYTFEAQITQKMVIPQPASFWHRKVVDNIGILRTDLHYAMDYEYWIRIGRHYSIIGLNEPLSEFRKTTLSKGGSQSFGWGPEFIKILDELYAESNLQSEIQSIKRKVYSSAYFHGAEGFLSTNTSNARTWLFKSLNFNLYIILTISWWRIFFKTLLGQRLYNWVRLLKFEITKQAKI